jgi:hypothetical protein
VPQAVRDGAGHDSRTHPEHSRASAVSPPQQADAHRDCFAACRQGLASRQAWLSWFDWCRCQPRYVKPKHIWIPEGVRLHSHSAGIGLGSTWTRQQSLMLVRRDCACSTCAATTITCCKAQYCSKPVTRAAESTSRCCLFLPLLSSQGIYGNVQVPSRTGRVSLEGRADWDPLRRTVRWGLKSSWPS